ncbi:putative uncharacterized protein ZNRD1-AS1 isoform X2 [Fukomys damarensis]|uniref:putative uncharacterized protein ZNRD1-AS1 isoform X2 n=1 Tax=Fukomys damarensis TaxID=885580 RepID=UPI00053FD186|nr:putative uncharacterized protein ZNRD1-AS1 isoform X2 [Fukomys damarensis]
MPLSPWFCDLELAWAKTSKDPRVAAGQQSPLEKKILNLGGMHTTAARYLITQKRQEEYETLCREQARSLDYWFAKAESYYNKRTLDIMEKEMMGNEIKMKMEEERTQGIEEQKHYYVVPERERKQIERHIHRIGQVKGCKHRTFRQPQPLSEMLPKIMPEKHGIQKAQRRKQVNEREQIQIKDHQERMIRGRELTQQRLKERILRKSQSQPPTHEKCGRAKKDIRELERVPAYPLFQPCGRSRVQVTVLMEKSQTREEVDTILKPSERKHLALPHFLGRQIEK